MLYDTLMWVHVFSAVVLLGPAYLFPALARLPGDYTTVLRVGVAVNRYVNIFLVVALLSGGWLIGVSPFTKDGGFSDARWLHTGMFLFFVAAGIHGAVAVPRTKKALAASEAGDEGAARKLLAPVERIFGPILALLGAAVVYLMLNKP